MTEEYFSENGPLIEGRTVSVENGVETTVLHLTPLAQRGLTVHISEPPKSKRRWPWWGLVILIVGAVTYALSSALAS